MSILQFSLCLLGYSQLFTIPTGAVNIQVKEITPTRNFLGNFRMIVFKGQCFPQILLQEA